MLACPLIAGNYKCGSSTLLHVRLVALGISALPTAVPHHAVLPLLQSSGHKAIKALFLFALCMSLAQPIGLRSWVMLKKVTCGGGNMAVASGKMSK